MRIHTVWIQRKQRYPGQCLPELVGAIDGIGHGENPEYIDRKIVEYKKQDDIKSIEHLILDLPDFTWMKVQKLLNDAITIQSDVIVTKT